MVKDKLKKLSFDELFNSTTMFYLNNSCEEIIENTINEQTEDILVGLKTISSKDTLKQYIMKHKDSLVCRLRGGAAQREEPDLRAAADAKICTLAADAARG